jgi:hypothetical protein
MKNYEILRSEIEGKFGKVYWFNDKYRNNRRRLKIYGFGNKVCEKEVFSFLEDKKYDVRNYLWYSRKCLVVYLND